MNTIEKREFIKSHLFKMNETYIDEVFQKMKALLQDDTLKTNKRIKPYTKEEYGSEVREALEQFERGKYSSLEDFEKESENWN